MFKVDEQIVLRLVKLKKIDADKLSDIKRDVLRTQKKAVCQMPTKAKLIKAYHNLLSKGNIKQSDDLEKLLIKRAVRTLSGVTIITVLTKPFPCPGKCIYCPSEDKMPKSYLSDEPAAARALMLKFDPYEQVVQRIKALEANGHPTDKIELIVKGGTWNAYPEDYQYWFILRCFQAANKTKKNIKILNIEILEKKLVTTQKINETAKHRIIGLTLETRPDYINDKTIATMRELGCTRVELGAQTTNDQTLKLIKRGHTVAETIKATELLKNNGFKVDYHLMPQLPGATPSKDLKMMLEIFTNPAFRPDMIKIYPCTVIENSELHNWLKKGKYKTYATDKLVEMLIKFKSQVPRYARISRLIRDIPGHHVKAGNLVTNLRQVIQKKMAERGLKCNCLRCREAGHQNKKSQIPMANDQLKLFIDKYEASGGTEYFLSFENSNREILYAFCRLRVNSNVTMKKCNNAIKSYIRELHTYGQAINIGNREREANQHKGLGKQLIDAVEKICRKNKVKKISVISGVGVREYYRRFGYRLEKTYMVKNLK